MLPRPTGFGIRAGLFYALLVTAFLAARYSNLFFLLLVFLASLAVCAAVAGRRNLAGLTGRITRIEPTPAGAGAPLHADLRAVGAPRFGVAVRLDLGNGGGRAMVPLGLVPGTASLSVRLPAMPRGGDAVYAACLVSDWPIGVFSERRAVEAPARVIVYPAPAEREARSAAGAGAVGELLSSQGAAGVLQPSHLREYREGDEMRRVHWKASARRRAPVVQEWEGGTGAGHEVVFDRRMPAEAFERALSLLSALALAAQEEKEPLTIVTQGARTSYGASHEPWDECFAFLAEAQPLPADAGPPPPAATHVPRVGGAA
jgi:uncharacterized protein (DUF58 family)